MAPEELPADLGLAGAFRLEVKDALPVSGSTGHELEDGAHAVSAQTAVDERTVRVVECRCKVFGTIKNRSDQYRSGIEFTMSAEQSEICDTLAALDKFLDELRKVKGDLDIF
jgi:hypothetical protein